MTGTAVDALAAVTRCGAPQPRLCVTTVVHINAAGRRGALVARAVAFVGHVVGVRHSI